MRIHSEEYLQGKTIGKPEPWVQGYLGRESKWDKASPEFSEWKRGREDREYDDQNKFGGMR